jgi:hypothetical protein
MTKRPHHTGFSLQRVERGRDGESFSAYLLLIRMSCPNAWLLLPARTAHHHAPTSLRKLLHRARQNRRSSLAPHECLEASGCNIPASEIEAGMELHLPCLVKVGQGNNGYKNIEEFLPQAAERPARAAST